MSSYRTTKELAEAVLAHPKKGLVKKLRRFDTVRDLERRGRINLLHDLKMLDRAVDIKREESMIIDLSARLEAIAS